ncbi:GNAT family N-acetyltransferase [Nocardia amamiensis]|uniref:GNAT family N-acetyltransferase n=1 Tax=Nocardia amamiensis TaxID=404578 RepID=UPI000834E013
MQTGIRVRPAQFYESDLVLDILAEAAAWLRGRGIEQWPERFPLESIRAQIESGSLMLVETETVAATFVVTERGEFWNDDLQALHVSRLAVRRSAAGRGLGYRILDWVQDQARRRCVFRVRLATSSDNPALRAYYEAAGFRYVADPANAKWPTSLYERVRGA